MPRSSRKTSASAEKLKEQSLSATTTTTTTHSTTTSNKRSIRWFVHPPSFSFGNNISHNNSNHNNSNHRQRTPTANPKTITTKSKFSTDKTKNHDDVQHETPRNKSNTAITTQKRWSLPLLGSPISLPPKEKHPAGDGDDRTDASSSPIVIHQLQRELEEAKEQILALQKVKELQAEEMERLRRDQQPEQIPSKPTEIYKIFTQITIPDNTDYDISSTCSLLDSSSLEDDTTPQSTLQNKKTTKKEDESNRVDDMQPEDGMATNTPVDPNLERADRPMTPSSMAAPSYWQALAFENANGIDDENDMDPFESFLPPMEVTAIRDFSNSSPIQASVSALSQNPVQLLAIRLRDAEQRASAYRQKLETSQDLVSSLFRDLERARRNIQSLISRNLSLSHHVKNLKIQQEDNTIKRKSLVKACVYITPVFVLCGGFEFFVSTILLVWILVELEASWYLGGEDDDEDDDDMTNEEEALFQLQEEEFPTPLAHEMPIPKSILLAPGEEDLDSSNSNPQEWQKQE